MASIYYAHHQWKYHTQIEAYELELIKRYFPDSEIFNPSLHLTSVNSNYPSKEALEEAVMVECLATVESSDILIFSSLDGCVGTGVYHEVVKAKECEKPIFYIYQDQLIIATNFSLIERTDGFKTDRLFAFVDHP